MIMQIAIEQGGRPDDGMVKIEIGCAYCPL